MALVGLSPTATPPPPDRQPARTTGVCSSVSSLRSSMSGLRSQRPKWATSLRHPLSQIGATPVPQHDDQPGSMVQKSSGVAWNITPPTLPSRDVFSEIHSSQPPSTRAPPGNDDFSVHASGGSEGDNTTSRRLSFSFGMRHTLHSVEVKHPCHGHCSMLASFLSLAALEP